MTSLQMDNDKRNTVSINNINIQSGTPGPGDVITYNNISNEWSFLPLSAGTGSTGPTGPTGTGTGSTGPTGPTGTGSTGPTGPTGPAPMFYRFSVVSLDGSYGEKEFPVSSNFILGNTTTTLDSVKMPTVLNQAGLLNSGGNFIQKCILNFSCTWSGYKSSIGVDYSTTGIIPVTVRTDPVPPYMRKYTIVAMINDNLNQIISTVYAAALQNSFDTSYTRTYITYQISVENAP
jgi:hypothetical protein